MLVAGQRGSISRQEPVAARPSACHTRHLLETEQKDKVADLGHCPGRQSGLCLYVPHYPYLLKDKGSCFDDKNGNKDEGRRTVKEHTCKKGCIMSAKKSTKLHMYMKMFSRNRGIVAFLQ